jgi:hypothetical protein
MRWNDWRLIAVLAGVILAVALLLFPGAGGDAFGGGCPMPPRHLSDITCRLPHAGCGDGIICFDGQFAFEIVVTLTIGGVVSSGIFYGLFLLCRRCSKPILEKLEKIEGELKEIKEQTASSKKTAS